MVRVAIATTGGPVPILYLTEEDGEIGRSAVCINGTTRQAGIDAGYNAFVRRPGGVVERLFGHAAYRLDVADAIDTGESWQLGVLVAHALQAVERLAQENDVPGTLVWATGTIRSVDLSVGGVGHVPDKLRISKQVISAALEAGWRVLVLLPEANAAEAEPTTQAWLRERGVPIHAIARVDEALALLDLPLVARAASQPEPVRIRWKGSPYPGLAPFDESWRAVFFGRGKAREECLALLHRGAARGRAFLLIHGRSGSGKSSLARAAIAGDVAEKARTSGTFVTAHMTPSSDGDGPLAALATALAQMTGAGVSDAILAGLRADPVTAATEVERDLTAEGTRRRGLLIVDQLEELLSRTALHPEAGLFAVALERLAHGRAVWIVATIRTDFLAALDQFAALSRLAADERVYRLDKPSRTDLIDIVAGPAAMAGLEFEQRPDRIAIPHEMAEIAARSLDGLPLLQVVLGKLYAEAGEDSFISYEKFDAIGGFEGALSVWANDAIDQVRITGVPEDAIERALSGLIRIDQDAGLALSRPIHLSDLQEEEAAVVRKLGRGRIVIVDQTGGEETARLAHEVLISHWDSLSRLVDQLKLLLQQRDRLDEGAERWDKGGRDGADLLHGMRVDEAQEFLREARDQQSRSESKDPTFVGGRIRVDALTTIFIEASIANAEAEAARRARDEQEKADEQARKLRDAQELAAERKSKVNRSRAALVALTVLAVIAGLGWFSSVKQKEKVQKSAVEAQMNAIEAEKARRLAEVARTEAETKSRISKSVVNKVVGNVVAELTDKDNINPEVVRGVLTSVEGAVNELDTAEPDDISIKSSKIEMLVQFGDILSKKGDFVTACKYYEAAENTGRYFVENKHHGNRYVARYVELIMTYEWCRENLGDLDGALLIANKATDLLSKLESEEDNKDSYIYLKSRIIGRVANIKREKGNLREAAADYEKAVILDRRWSQQNPDKNTAKYNLSISLGRVAWARLVIKDYKGAQEATNEHIEVIKNLSDANQHNTVYKSGLSGALRTSARIKSRQKDHIGALEALNKSIILDKDLFQQDKNNAEWVSGLVHSYYYLSSEQYILGEKQEALASIREGSKIIENISTDPANVRSSELKVMVLTRQARIENMLKLIDEAIISYKKVLDIRELLLSINPDDKTRQKHVITARQDFDHPELASNDIVNY